MSPPRITVGRAAAVLGAAIVALFIMWPVLWDAWQSARYGRAFHDTIDEPVKFVEYQPNTDWPQKQITDQKQIEKLKAWLLATSEESPLRSAPPGAVCKMRFVFHSGHELQFSHSPFREPLGKDGHDDCRSGVRFYLLGHWRIGSAASLAEIFELVAE
jgi:hypothetical protein